MAIVNRSEDDVVVDSTLPSQCLITVKQFATIVDVLSEGEIEGFPSAAEGLQKVQQITIQQH